MENSFFSIYVHIPFCLKKCNYCSFYSIVVEERGLINDYIDAISKEVKLRYDIIERFLDSYRTIYFGGGTPSILDSGEIKKLLRIFYNIKEFSKLDEITFEVNPDTIDEEKLKVLKDFGVNRISIGLETSIDKYLKFLGRRYTFDVFVKKYELVKKYFNNINIDIIYGIYKQEEEEFLTDIEKVIELNPQHISAYSLEIHPSTPFENLVIDEDKQARFYFVLKENLEKNGYIHYEISNFSLPDRYSIHNMNYWNRGNYLGFGPSSASLISSKRWKNISDVLLYNLSLDNGKIELEYEEELSENDIMKEKLILGLRKIEGISINSNLYFYYQDKITSMMDYFEIKNEKIKIKDQYLFVSNHIISQII